MTKAQERILRVVLAGVMIGVLLGVRSHILPDVPALAPDKLLLAQKHFPLLAVIGWLIFGIYWEYIGKKSAPIQSAESSFSRAFHVFLTNLALLLQILPIYGFGRFMPVWPGVMSAGLVLEWLGLLLAIWSRRHLGQNWSGAIAIKVEHQLIRSGPYSVLRHPIYTGLLMMYAGTLLVMGERLGVVGFVIALFAYARKIWLEEASMSKAFGAEFDDYRSETWAVVPGLF